MSRGGGYAHGVGMYTPPMGGSRISFRREHQPSGEGGHQHMILPNFPKNCTKLRKFWAVRDGAFRGGASPLDPPPQPSPHMGPTIPIPPSALTPNGGH